MAFCHKAFRDSYHGQLLMAARYSRMPFQDVKEATDLGEDVILEGLRLTGAYDEAYFEGWQRSVLSTLDVQQLLWHDTSVILGANDQSILRAWRECKADEGGFTMYVTAPTDTSAVVNIEWFPFRSDPKGSNPHVQEFIIQPAIGVKITSGQHSVSPGAQFGKRIEYAVALERPAGSHLLFTLKMIEFEGLQQAYLPAKHWPSKI
jgi:hypothetical protein